MSGFGESIRIGNMEVESPWGNAGGVVRTIEETDKMAQTGVGWIELGSYTLDPRAGNDQNGTRIVFVHDTLLRLSYNSISMKNKGMDVVEKELPEMADISKDAGKPILVNVAPVGDDPAAESAELVERVYKAGANKVLLNLSCPNILLPGGGRHGIISHDPYATNYVLKALNPIVERFGKIAVRVAPQETEEQASAIVHAIGSAGTADSVFVPNTWGGSKPRPEIQQLEVEGGTGGMSGPGIADRAYEQTVWFAGKSTLDIVSSAGIDNGVELKRRMDIDSDGFVKGGAGTTLYYIAEESWSRATDRLLWEYVEA